MNFSVESKYPLSIFKNNDLTISWNTIKVGCDLNRLTPEEVGKFASYYLKQHPDITNEYISDLIFGVKEERLDTCLKQVFDSLGLQQPQKNSPEWNKEWLKWRYSIIAEMIKSIPNKEELLDYIEGVYADFGYPEDMTPFIYYVPQEGILGSKFVEPSVARSNLVKKIKIFLEKEKERIATNVNIEKLPSRVIEEE